MDGQTERRKSEGFSSGPDRLRKAFQGRMCELGLKN